MARCCPVLEAGCCSYTAIGAIGAVGAQVVVAASAAIIAIAVRDKVLHCAVVRAKDAQIRRVGPSGRVGRRGRHRARTPAGAREGYRRRVGLAVVWLHDIAPRVAAIIVVGAADDVGAHAAREARGRARTGDGGGRREGDGGGDGGVGGDGGGSGGAGGEGGMGGEGGGK